MVIVSTCVLPSLISMSIYSPVFVPVLCLVLNVLDGFHGDFCFCSCSNVVFSLAVFHVIVVPLALVFVALQYFTDCHTLFNFFVDFILAMSEAEDDVINHQGAILLWPS